MKDKNKKQNRRLFFTATIFMVLFVLWTVLVCFADTKTIGPEGTSVGFATLNECVHKFTGVNLSLYIITDWLGLVPICTVAGFAILGLSQWIKRKKLFKVDQSILILGVFYIVVMAIYIFFEIVVINYRPILIDGVLEVSYPSSTTMLVMCVMPSAMIQLRFRIKNHVFRRCAMILITVFIAFMVIARLASGVHWITDIIGGALVSAALVLMYYSISNKITKMYK